MLKEAILFSLLYLSVLYSPIRIINIEGTLFGNQADQALEMDLNYDAEYENISNFIFVNESDYHKGYFADSICLKDSLYYNKSFCILNLTNVPPGNYFIYPDDHHPDSVFQYNGTIEVRDIKRIYIGERRSIIDYLILNSKLYKNFDFQNFTLSIYGKDINNTFIKRLILKDSENLYNLPLSCERILDSDVNCRGYFGTIKPNLYYVYGVENDDGLFFNLLAQNISFMISKEEDRVKKDITLNYIEGMGYYNEISSFYLNFSEKVDSYLFEAFFLKNENNLRYYNAIYECNSTIKGLSNILRCNFDFMDAPIGNYTLKYIYDSETYESKVTFEIKERKKEDILDENQLLNVYGNLKRNKNIDYAFFTFNGKRNIYLAYMVLTDGNKRKNFVQILNCKMVDYSDDLFDLKCEIDLSYVSEGEYTITEYYINNQHYFTNLVIRVN